MEESAKESSFGFNKRRAEGRDKDVHDKKKLQLKVRKLNPINTLSYVQVSILAFWGISNCVFVNWVCFSF